MMSDKIGSIIWIIRAILVTGGIVEPSGPAQPQDPDAAIRNAASVSGVLALTRDRDRG